MQVETPAPEAVDEGVLLLTAVTDKQMAVWDWEVEHGLFTHHLLDALYGKADTSGDDKVTASEVEAYVAGWCRHGRGGCGRRRRNRC